MRVVVHLFAAPQALVGDSEVTLELSEPGTIRDLRRELLQRYPQLQELGRHLRFAVNANFATDDSTIVPQDEIACIPPVSGG